MTLRRIALVLGCAGLAGLVWAPGASAASSQTVERPMQASIKTIKRQESSICANCGPNGTPMELHGCSFVAVVEFARVPRAVSYSVVVSDTRLGNRSFTGPPFSDNEDGRQTPAGVHWFGLSGGAGPGDCSDAEAEMNARYKVVKAVATLGCAGTAQGARSAVRSVFCPPVKVDMKEIKAQAEKARRFWSSATISASGISLTFGTISNVPHPVVKVVSIFFATIFGIVGMFDAYQAEQATRIVADPPDRRWRIIARAPTIRSSRLVLPRGLTRAQAAAGRALAIASLRVAANAQCVTWSIDRGTTAMNVRRPTFAARQYRAGAACARSSARIMSSMPRLVAPLLEMARSVDDDFQARAGAPNRRAIPGAATRQYAALGRLMAIPPGRLAAMRRAAIRKASTAQGASAPLPSAVLAQLAAESSSQAGLMTAAAAALTKAAGGPLR